MSLVYQFPSSVLTDLGKIVSANDELKKAILKAKCTPEHADAFNKAYDGKKQEIRALVQAIGSAAIDKVKGKDAFMALNDKHKTLARVFTATVMVPQFKFQSSSFDLSVHLKGTNLQVWLSYKGGGTQTMLDVKKP